MNTGFLYLLVLGSDFISTNHQPSLNDLQLIANQCPLEGGNAVYEARAMLGVLGTIQVYDDQALCGRAKALQRPPVFDGKSILPNRSLQVYPNPARNIVMVQWTKSDFQKGHLVVIDLFGRQVFAQVLESGDSSIEIDLSAFSSGVYFIQVKLDEQTPMIHKVVISK